MDVNYINTFPGQVQPVVCLGFFCLFVCFDPNMSCLYVMFC